jgi:DHA2 family multidrug resistance protein
MLACFILRELSAKVPAVRIQLFKDKTFLAGTLISGVMFAVMLANMFLLPVFMQVLLGYSATQSGIALMPRVLAMMVVVPFVGRLYNHIEPRLMVVFGVSMQVVGAFFMSRFTLQISTWGIIFPLVVQGIGMACLFVPLTTAAISTIPRTQLSDATGLYSLSRQIGGSFGLAIFATLLTNFHIRVAGVLSSHLSVTSPMVRERLALMTRAFTALGQGTGAAHSAALRALQGLVSQQAMVIAFEKTFLLGGITFLCVLPIVMFLKADRASRRGGHAPELHAEA